MNMSGRTYMPFVYIEYIWRICTPLVVKGLIIDVLFSTNFELFFNFNFEALWIFLSLFLYFN